MTHSPEKVYPRVLPLGDTAFTIELGEGIDQALNRRVHALDAKLTAEPIPGIVECVPTYRSLLVRYDPLQVDPGALRGELLALARSSVVHDAPPPGRLITVPVRYGGTHGPDLEDVARHCGLSADEVVRLHTEPLYQVAMLGFAPGFTYLLGLPPALTTPRLPTPRLRVPPGSVGIAGGQTGIYALATPGGWRIIGRTTLRLFDPARADPFLIHAGDRVRFVPEHRE